ncbi:MAG TPA: SIS domain-containing protein [Mycobacteriales bacterium]|nr:SIS domain-containing protein [Mycobacteriales bacterium]
MTFSERIAQRINDSIATKQELLTSEAAAALPAVVEAVVTCLRGGGTVFFCGNGGSSTDAEHLSAELLGRFYYDRTALPSVNLSSNVAAVTAIGNDYGYDLIFARPLRGLGKKGDVLIGLSTSGNSANVIRAVEVAQELGMTAVGMTGSRGGKLAEIADHALKMPSDDTPRIQECHMLLGHTLCELVEEELCPPG